MKDKGIKLLADYVFLSKYAQRKPDDKLECWEETIERIYDMHRVKLGKLGLLTPETEKMLKKAMDFENHKKILSSQRGRQFASPFMSSGILKHEAKMYNCCSTYIDRIEVFSEIMYLLLCGCGVGYSLHKEYINKLPSVAKEERGSVINFSIEDSIEGWADSIDILVRCCYKRIKVNFDYSKIRPEGALIDGKFVAPGPEPLEKAHKNIVKIFNLAVGRKLTSIELHDVLCYIAESVVSGGVRRSAMIALFDADDELMLKAKTGNWWKENPQRAMANNSILSSMENALKYNEIKEKLQIIRQFGEPGFVNVRDYRYTVNPCGEIVMEPNMDGDSGFAFCNLVEINAEKIVTDLDFYEACEVAAFIATVQSLYTDFKYLSLASRNIAERDRAIGVSITGILSNPLFKKGDILKHGANSVVKTNSYWASIFNINKSKACTTVKPSGNASSILGIYCSGIHPAHDRKYIRRVRIKTNSPEYKALKDTPMVKLLRDDEAVISFPIETNNPDIVVKNEISAVEHLKFIGMVKHYWINKGCRVCFGDRPNNISATVEVKDDEWDEVAAVLFADNYLFTGVSLLPKLGDQIYDNAPFQRLSSDALIKEYNDIKEYIETHDVDFNAIMSERENIYSGDMAAIGCSGGACELK